MICMASDDRITITFMFIDTNDRDHSLFLLACLSCNVQQSSILVESLIYTQCSACVVGFKIPVPFRVPCCGRESFPFHFHISPNVQQLLQVHTVHCRKVHLDDSTKCSTLDGTALSRTYAVILSVKISHHWLCPAYLNPPAHSLPHVLFHLLTVSPHFLLLISNFSRPYRGFWLYGREIDLTRDPLDPYAIVGI